MPSLAASDSLLPEELFSRAIRLELDESAEWRSMLHFTKVKSAGSDISRVDSRSFFLAKDGKTNPRSELRESIARLIIPTQPTTGKAEACRFPLRYEFLTQALELESSMPKITELCPSIQNMLNVQPTEAVTLVFADSYLNNPASMFGHTFLKLSSERSKHSALLDTTISFAADTRENRGVFFALKGLFGKYEGKFFYGPYATRVLEYADSEHRDLWEFELTLSKTEIRKMLLHLVELEESYFDYYFIDENCSYALIALLDVVKPDLALVNAAPPWVTPIETIRIANDAELIAATRYRPSPASRLATLETSLQDSEREIVKALQDQSPVHHSALEGFSEQRQAMILDTAIVLEAFREPNLQSGTSRKEDLLKERSQVPVSPAEYALSEPDFSPLDGHDNTRISAGYGVEDGRHFYEFSGRLVYHSREDPPAGYRDSALEFLNVTFRSETQTETLELEEIILLELHSVPASSDLLPQFSWYGVAGASRFHINESRSLMPYLSGGLGISKSFANVKFSSFLSAQSLFSGHVRSAVEIGVGPETVVAYAASTSLRFFLSGRAYHNFLASQSGSFSISTTARYAVAQNVDFEFKLTREKHFSSVVNSAFASVLYYF